MCVVFYMMLGYVQHTCVLPDYCIVYLTCNIRMISYFHLYHALTTRLQFQMSRPVVEESQSPKHRVHTF